jgi:hypothetical protein
MATPGASLCVGCLCLALLCWKGRHRGVDGTISRANIASAVMLGASLYTMIVLIIGEFYVGRRVSEMIQHGFGDGRAAWLLVALALDTAPRVWSLFDPPAPSAK